MASNVREQDRKVGSGRILEGHTGWNGLTHL
jgi:hypothetical protein